MDQFSIKIDTETRDLVFDTDGIMDTLTGDELTAQNIRNTLNTRKGEFILDETHGTDYGRILGRDSSEVLSNDEGNEVIRDAILQEPQVTIITAIAVEINPERLFTATFSAETANGSQIAMEVEADG